MTRQHTQLQISDEELLEMVHVEGNSVLIKQTEEVAVAAARIREFDLITRQADMPYIGGYY